MGLNVALVNYKCERLESVGDPKNFLHKLLPPVNEDSDSLLAKIDWYGDTYFNYLQMKRFLEEWDQLSKRTQNQEEQSLVEGVRNLAMLCQKDRNVLKFIGD
jgi:hypothetical protein